MIKFKYQSNTMDRKFIDWQVFC